MTDTALLAARKFRPLSDPACKLAGPYASMDEAVAALYAADFVPAPPTWGNAWGGESSGYDGQGRYARVVGIYHSTQAACFAVEVMPVMLTAETVAVIRYAAGL